MLETNQYTHDNNYCLFEYHDYHDYQIIAHLSYKRAYVCMFSGSSFDFIPEYTLTAETWETGDPCAGDWETGDINSAAAVVWR